MVQNYKGEYMINQEVKNESLLRLKKIEGQIRGIMKMVENDKYCIDIINQITAAEKALKGVSKIIMKRHVESCVATAISMGQGKEAIDELVETIYKVGK
jgi:DNA-binding FrmR family transcriptional regulator